MLLFRGSNGFWWLLKFGYSEKATKFQKIFHLKFDATQVGNIWFLSPLVLSKWEDLAFSVCIIFEKSVFIFQFLNDEMHNYVKHNCFSLKNWKINTLSSKSIQSEKTKFSRLSFLSFEKSVFIFQFLNNKTHKCIKQNIIVHFIIQKLKNKHTFLKNYTNWES